MSQWVSSWSRCVIKCVIKVTWWHPESHWQEELNKVLDARLSEPQTFCCCCCCCCLAQRVPCVCVILRFYAWDSRVANIPKKLKFVEINRGSMLAHISVRHLQFHIKVFFPLCLSWVSPFMRKYIIISCLFLILPLQDICLNCQMYSLWGCENRRLNAAPLAFKITHKKSASYRILINSLVYTSLTLRYSLFGMK